MSENFIDIGYHSGSATSDLKEWGILTYDAQVKRLARLSTTQDPTKNPDVTEVIAAIQKMAEITQALISQHQDPQQNQLPCTRWVIPSNQVPVLLKPQDPSSKE